MVINMTHMYINWRTNIIRRPYWSQARTSSTPATFQSYAVRDVRTKLTIQWKLLPNLKWTWPSVTDL